MKAIHNCLSYFATKFDVVLYPKDTEKWKQFTTTLWKKRKTAKLFCIPKILKNESNSQPKALTNTINPSCFVSQRYWKMKAIHNDRVFRLEYQTVVLYPKDTEKWKQFTTQPFQRIILLLLFCIPKILKNESNSQPKVGDKLKLLVVLYPKDTEKWKQFTTEVYSQRFVLWLFCIPKILKNESNSQPKFVVLDVSVRCFVSQRYWKMKAIHNYHPFCI